LAQAAMTAFEGLVRGDKAWPLGCLAQGLTFSRTLVALTLVLAR